MDLFVFLLLSLSSLHNLGNSPLSDVYFANILSQSMTSHSLGVAFCRAEVFNFSKFCFSVLSFRDHVFAAAAAKLLQSCLTLCDQPTRLLSPWDSPGKNTGVSIAYWATTELGSSSFSILSFCLFILFMGFSRQEY